MGYAEGWTPESQAQKEARRFKHLPTAQKIRESFRWMSPSWKALTFTPKTCKVKGVALLSNVVSKNKRKYLDEELKRTARTLINKPISVNHDSKNIIGNILGAEYEDNQIEWFGQVKKKTYVDMLKNKDPAIKGVSVEASYLHLKCTVCGTKFYTEASWADHMSAEHGIRDGVKEVHGIYMDGLSVVVSPEIPGVPGTRIEVMEAARNDMLRIQEMFLEERGFAIKKESGIGVTRTKHNVGLKLGEPKDEHGCEPDEVWDAEQLKCVKKTEAKEQTEQEEEPVECPEGKAWNPITQACEPLTEIYKRRKEILKACTKKQALRIFEAVITQADKNVDDYKEHIAEDLGQKIDFLVDTCQVLLRNHNNMIKETESRDMRLEERVQTLEENARAAVKGKFKGVTPNLTKGSDPSYADGWVPLKKRKK